MIHMCECVCVCVCVRARARVCCFSAYFEVVDRDPVDRDPGAVNSPLTLCVHTFFSSLFEPASSVLFVG